MEIPSSGGCVRGPVPGSQNPGAQRARRPQMTCRVPGYPGPCVRRAVEFLLAVLDRDVVVAAKTRIAVRDSRVLPYCGHYPENGLHQAVKTAAFKLQVLASGRGQPIVAGTAIVLR